MKFYTLLAFVLISLCVSSSDAPNYQQRRLYYTEKDHCCIHNIDEVRLTIRFKDRNTIQKTIRGNTFCNTTKKKYDEIIVPGSTMCYKECYEEQTADAYCDNLCFWHETAESKTALKVVSISQKAFLKNPAQFDRTDYNCVIEGDGTVQHYGPIGSIPTPQISVSCIGIIPSISTEAS